MSQSNKILIACTIALVGILISYIVIFFHYKAFAQMDNSTITPQIPLQDAPYPNEVVTPYIASLLNTSHAFMVQAYKDQLKGDMTGYYLEVGNHNAMVCVHAQMNNDTALMGGCDSTMVQQGILIHKFRDVVPNWFATLVDNYLKARGIE